MSNKLFSDKFILTSKLKPLIVNGSIYYNDKEGAHNLLRLKKDVINEFIQLNNKEVSPAYRMEFYRNSNQLLKRIEELGQEGKLPVLLFFYTQF